MTKTVLHIDSSIRAEGSVSRALSEKITSRFEGANIIRRDLADGVPLIDGAWIGANFTPADDRTTEQNAVLATSDAMVAELQAADVIVIGTPVYNFSVTASMKAWIDLVARAGVTFKYTDTGPVGLLAGKRAIIAIASGGTPVDSEIDFAGRYIRHIMGFIGITEVEFVKADSLGNGGEAKIADAHAQVATIAA
jgi:FMN-dependent NADH-azoreductase